MKIKNDFNLIWLMLLFILIISCSGSDSVAPEVNDRQLDETYTTARSMAGLQSLLVSHNGYIIKEEYFNGSSSETTFDVRSVTKSITSLLVGITIDKQVISSVDQIISTYLSSLVYSYPIDKANLTIRHLITMSGGFQGNELTEPNLYNDWSSSSDRISYILNVPLIYQSGSHFSYDSRPYNLLSVIVTVANRLNTKQFAETNLFTPLGIGSRNWLADQQDYFNGSAGLYLSGRDMIKIGGLLLNNGLHNGNRIISADWINQLKKSKITTNNAILNGSDYSYGWWLGRYNNKDYVMAMGWGGQFIVVVPDFNLVVTATNAWSGLTDTAAKQRWQNTIDLIMTRILTAFN